MMKISLPIYEVEIAAPLCIRAVKGMKNRLFSFASQNHGPYFVPSTLAAGQ